MLEYLSQSIEIAVALNALYIAVCLFRTSIVGVIVAVRFALLIAITLIFYAVEVDFIVAWLWFLALAVIDLAFAAVVYIANRSPWHSMAVFILSAFACYNFILCIAALTNPASPLVNDFIPAHFIVTLVLDILLTIAAFNSKELGKWASRGKYGQ